MAKIQDKLFNRVIEGDLLELSEADKERAGLGGGGTQLYKHTVHFGDYYFKCLSQKATVFTDINDMVKNTICYYDGREFDPTSGFPIIILGYDASALKMVYISGTTISEASGTDITDTVTPL